MRVLVKGPSGNVGKIACEHLLANNWEVVGLGRTSIPATGVEFHSGDVTDYPLLCSAMKGCDAVLHLAAYNMPFSAIEPEIFRVNVGGVYNIFCAAKTCGIKHVCIASSPNAIGYNFGNKMQDIKYLPVDGRSPLFTTDPYSFSKQCIEEIGRYFYRRFGMSSVYLRLGLDFTLTLEEWVKSDKVPVNAKKLKKLRERILDLLDLPTSEAAKEVRRIENELNERRNVAMTKNFKNGTEYVYDEFDEEQQAWNYIIHNFVMFLDKRDLADACLKSITAQCEGSNVIFIADHKNMLGIEARKLAGLCYPGATLDYSKLNGCDAMVDFREAEKVIGFHAEHSFETVYGQIFH